MSVESGRTRLKSARVDNSAVVEISPSDTSSTSTIPLTHPDIQEDADADDLEEVSGSSEKFFRIEFSFTMEFDGLLAKYRFWCPDIQYSREGSIKLPDCYSFITG